MSKQQMLDCAEIIDGYRIFPRLFLLGCFLWAIGITHEILHWYMSLPQAQRGLEGGGGFATAVEIAVMGFLKMVYSTYSENGRNWNQTLPTTTTTAAVTQQVTSP